jgi:hypothetical protein
MPNSLKACVPSTSVPSLRCPFHDKKVKKVCHFSSSESRSLPRTRMPPSARKPRPPPSTRLQGRNPPSLSQHRPAGKRGKRVPHHSSPFPFTTGWG